MAYLDRHERLRQNLRALSSKLPWGPSFTRSIELQIIMDWLNPEKGDLIADIACGGGGMTYRIAKKGCAIYGIDISECAIKSTKIFSDKQNVKCGFAVGNAESLPLRSGSFDKVICSSALEHFQNDDKALVEMRGILKIGGILVLTVDSLSYPGMKREIIERHREISSVANYYTRERLIEELEHAGFEVVCSKYYLNSFVSAFFFDWGIKLGWGLRYVALSIIAYPLCLIADRLWGKDEWGMGLAVKAVRV